MGVDWAAGEFVPWSVAEASAAGGCLKPAMGAVDWSYWLRAELKGVYVSFVVRKAARHDMVVGLGGVVATLRTSELSRTHAEMVPRLSRSNILERCMLQQGAMVASQGGAQLNSHISFISIRSKLSALCVKCATPLQAF
jgi:hypothetical protein